MKVLVADAFPKERMAQIAGARLTVEHRPELTPRDLPAAMAGVTALVVRGKQVTAEVFQQADALSLVIRAGAGVNTIDVAAASRVGVYRRQLPGAERHRRGRAGHRADGGAGPAHPDNVIKLRAGQWDKKAFSEAEGLFGRALGVAGTGPIGRETIKRARASGSTSTPGPARWTRPGPRPSA